MIKLDGNYGEGGGAIIRVALSLSTLTGKQFKVTNIRKGRSQPGLKNQHLYGIKALKELCYAKVKGDFLGSTSLEFIPRKMESKNLNIDIGTAGSITLILQSILLPLMFADKKIILKITGGTDTKWSPQYDYTKEVLLPQLKKFADINMKLKRRGYYPKGSGKVEILVNQKYKLSTSKNFEDFWKRLRDNIKPQNLTEQGNLLQIKGVSHASNDLQKANVAERQAKAAKHLLSSLNCPISIETSYDGTLSTGSGITLYAYFLNKIVLGADSLGEKSKRAEIVGNEAAERLLKEIKSNAAVDFHLADNLIPIMGLIPNSKIKTSAITSHCKTNIWVTEKFLHVKFKINEKENIISAKAL